MQTGVGRNQGIGGGVGGVGKRSSPFATPMLSKRYSDASDPERGRMTGYGSTGDFKVMQKSHSLIGAKTNIINTTTTTAVNSSNGNGNNQV